MPAPDGPMIRILMVGSVSSIVMAIVRYLHRYSRGVGRGESTSTHVNQVLVVVMPGEAVT